VNPSLGEASPQQPLDSLVGYDLMFGVTTVLWVGACGMHASIMWI